MESYHIKLARNGEMGEGGQKVQHFSYRTNQFWGM